MTYDLLILGGGIAGTTAAALSARKGLRTALLCGGQLGGVCLHSGCIPAKFCLQNDFPDDASRAKRRADVIGTLSEGLLSRLERVDIFYENGALRGKTDVFSVLCGVRGLTAKNVLLCTGSVPHRPGLSPEDIFTSDTLPQRAVILGAGAAGLECASYLRKSGADVTLLEQRDRLLPQAEPEISAALLRSFRRRGIAVRFGVDTPPKGETVIFADGRVPAVRGIGLRTVGLAKVVTDAHMQTAVPGLYAAGDVRGEEMTAHAAAREAQCAVRRICGEADAVDYRALPHVLFTDPAVMWVGETQRGAQERGVQARAVTVPLRSVGGYLAAGGDGTGVCRLVADGAGTILGVHLCGGDAPELSAAAVVLVQQRVRVRELERMTFAHPTVGEALREAAACLEDRQS